MCDLQTLRGANSTAFTFIMLDKAKKFLTVTWLRIPVKYEVRPIRATDFLWMIAFKVLNLVLNLGSVWLAYNLQHLRRCLYISVVTWEILFFVS